MSNAVEPHAACEGHAHQFDALVAQLHFARHSNDRLHERLLRAQHHQPILISTRFNGSGYGWPATSALLAISSLLAVMQAIAAVRQLRHQKAYWRTSIERINETAHQVAGQLSGTSALAEATSGQAVEVR